MFNLDFISYLAVTLPLFGLIVCFFPLLLDFLLDFFRGD